MNKKQWFLFIIFCLLTANFYGQQTPATAVEVSYEKNNTGDTILLTVKASKRSGTLMLVASRRNFTNTDTVFFPIIDKVNLFALAIPPMFQTGKLQLTAFFYPQIFSINGKVLSNINDETINAVLITDNQRLYNKAIKINADKEFTLPPLVFENKGSLAFNYANGKTKNKNHPDISIHQIPFIANFTDTVFNESIVLSEETTIPNTPVKAPGDSTPVFNDKRGVLLSNVTVTAQRKSKAEKFNEENSTGLFNDASERVIDCLENNDVLSYPDCLSFLRSKVPGLNVQLDKFGENKLSWRGHETKAFFIDEISVDIEQLLSVAVNDIAIVKAYPPPFIGSAGGGDGGAIAIYIRKGEYRREGMQNSKWLFTIKGYSPAVHVLFSGN